MKNRILPFFIYLLFAFPISLMAQAPCGFDELHTRMLQNDPDYARQVQLNEESIQRFIQQHPENYRPNAAYTIPVVVHVMHTGGAVGTIYNPSDAQILGAINYLNQVFAGTYPGMSAPIEGGGVVDLEIQFALAQRTPSCGSTNGIDRVDASSLPNYVANGINMNTSSGCPEVTMKNLARWNTSDYYNIWLVNKIDGADGTSGQFIAGFAYFPGSSSTVDGTVMLATQMVAGQKTLPHEIGHALNLYHTFQGSANNTQCPTNGNCSTDGDRVCDTDPVYNNYNAATQLYSFSCRTGSNTCASPNNYSINTESNFMAYTNCYTLFTNGQKARVQAAMSLASRASLVAVTNQALVPCGTVVNFNQSSATQTEDPTGTLSGCRRYRDYSYLMTIGSAPSAAATATLSFSGTAIKGLDYEVTTNGNFVTPGNTVTFNTGTSASQPVTVRIYDDANVESTESIIIDFTLNNGGGNAVKGTTYPTLTITVGENDVAPVGTSTGTVSIGSITSYITAAPFDATLPSQRAQYLYKASELTAAGITAGNITSLELYIFSKLSTRAFNNFTIKMGQTSNANLVDGGVSPVSGLTTVYNPASHNTTSGWNTFNFSTPFSWNGTSNLVVEICYDNGSVAPGDVADQVGTYSDGSSAGQGNMFWQNGINCSGSFSTVSYYGSGVKPIVRLGVSIVGTTIETVASSNSSLHIDNGSGDYFYSNNNSLMMRLAGVNASLGCVSASLDAGGTSWIPAFGGQRSAKVFNVTPTTNGAGTYYTISLYFDVSELDGKTPSTLRIAKTTAASAAAANATNTIMMTPTVTTLGANTVVFTANFVGFSRFFLVDAGATLPVTFIDFTARAQADNNTELKWATSFEQDNDYFAVETSQDGINFAQIGMVRSQGNSGSRQDYDFIHNNPPTGTSWYRLRQVDLDGRVTYSRTVSVTISKDVVVAHVFPVPTTGKLTISFGEWIQATELTIYNTDLQIVKREVVGAPSIQKEMDLSGLPSGIYFVRYRSGNSMKSVRIVKQ